MSLSKNVGTFNQNTSMSKIGIPALKIEEFHEILQTPSRLALSGAVIDKIEKSHHRARKMAQDSKAIYGINTGFGPLCQTKISVQDTAQLQRNLLLSHAVGVGNPVAKKLSKIMLLLKIHALAQGYSGISLAVLERLIYFFKNDLIPVVPEQGSVGASGDLAPLAHLFIPLIGEGEFWQGAETVSAVSVLEQHNLTPLTLQPKEGLALINGTQFILAHALVALDELSYLMDLADVTAAMTLEGFQGSATPYAAALHALRPFAGTQEVAQRMRTLLKDSKNLAAHADCDRIQDPYSIRCVPQVHGATRNAWMHLHELVHIELNAVTDNPVIVGDDQALSGGNFHGQPLALALDYLTLAAAELGNIADRRCYLLLEGLHGLPPMLSQRPGLNSGFMIAQYTTAALVTENKTLCYPASADSVPTGRGQEDHVSMGSISGRKCLQVIDNLKKIIAIELMHAAQAMEFRRPLRFSTFLEQNLGILRQVVPALEEDRLMSADIEKVLTLVNQRALNVTLS